MKLKDILFNPFTRIAGINSLIIGSVIVLISSIIGFYTNAKYDGVLDLHVGADYMPTFWMNILLGQVNYIVFAIFLYIFGIIFTKTRIRFIDVVGTQSLARYPYIIAPALFFLIPDSLNEDTIMNAIMQGEPINITYLEITGFMVFTLISLVLLVWMIALMYNANKVATNLKGKKAVFSFILSIILSSIVLKIIWNRVTDSPDISEVFFKFL